MSPYMGVRQGTTGFARGAPSEELDKYRVYMEEFRKNMDV